MDHRLIDTVADGFEPGVRLIEAVDRSTVHVQFTGGNPASSWWARLGV